MFHTPSGTPAARVHSRQISRNYRARHGRPVVLQTIIGPMRRCDGTCRSSSTTMGIDLAPWLALLLKLGSVE